MYYNNSKMSTSNESMIKKFTDEVKLKPVTKADYIAKLTKLSQDIDFADDESNLLPFFEAIQNPNTRSNKAFALIRLRQHIGLPVDMLIDLRERNKKDIDKHRKKQASDNVDNLISYSQLLKELKPLTGKPFIMNYLFAHYGLRNNDINAIVTTTNPTTLKENTFYINPSTTAKKIIFHIVDYKTASTYGPKKISITNKKLYDELLAIGDGNYVFAKGTGEKPTIQYMNVLVSRLSIRNYGEGKIAKILVKNYIDKKQYDKLSQLSRTRGTALSTLSTNYNMYDNK